MNSWIQAFCVYVVIGMGIGFGVLVMLYLYWAIFEKIINIAGIKKEFIQFVWDKHNKQDKTVAKVKG